MAKTIVKFPNGVERVRYITKRAGSMEETTGKKRQTAYANTVYYKPTLRKLVIRAPGVRRVSEDVRAINEQLRKLTGQTEHPSHFCGGRSWRERIICLKKEMKKAIKPVAEVMGE